MSIYKDGAYSIHKDFLMHMANAHAKTINKSFECLGHNAHSSAACGTCQSHGRYFRSLVRQNLNPEVINHVSQSIDS